MQLALTPATVLLLAVIAQALLAAGLLWWAPLRRLANRFLALLMLAIALWLLDGFFRVSGLYGQAPGLYFYVRSLLGEDFRWRWRRDSWHLLPVLAQAGLYWWLRFQPYNFRNWFWVHVHRPYTYRLEFLGTWVSLLVYLGLSLRLLRHYRRWLADNFSETSALRLRWLRWLLLLLGVVSVQWGLELVLREFFGLYYRYDYSTELLGGVLFVVGIVGLRQAAQPPAQVAEAELTAEGAGPHPLAPSTPPCWPASSTRSKPSSSTLIPRSRWPSWLPTPGWHRS